MFQDSIQTPIQPILRGHGSIDLQKLIHGTAIKPLPMQAKLAAWSDEAIDYQQRQYLLPLHTRSPVSLQTRMPELIQLQFPPRPLKYFFSPQKPRKVRRLG